MVTGLLNFSVFVRQLRAARDQLETARRQLESARQRPYFYDNTAWVEADVASINEVNGGVNTEQLRLCYHSFSSVSGISDPRR